MQFIYEASYMQVQFYPPYDTQILILPLFISVCACGLFQNGQSVHIMK